MSKRLTLEQLAKAGDRFWSKVDIRGKGECWPYQGYINVHGYGKIGIDRYPRSAHRVAWMLHNEQLIPDTMFVLHSCDNKTCCNPAHLRLGTHRDNVDDAIVRRRYVDTRSRGVNHHNSRLTRRDVLDIRQRFAEGEIGPTLAEEYGINSTIIHGIVYGKTYSRIDGPIAGKDYVIHGRRWKRIEWLS